MTSCSFEKCERFYYASRNQRYYIVCQSSNGNAFETPKLYFDNVDENPSAWGMCKGSVSDGVHFEADGDKVTVSFDSPQPQHFHSYTLSASCKGHDASNKVQHVFNLIEIVKGQDTFADIDYIIFSLFLAASLLIGVGFAVWAYRKNRKAHKEPSTTDFLLAGRSMHFFPLTLSMISSFMSAIALIGTPSEIYAFGAAYLTICFCYFLAMPLAAHVLMPFFYNLGITSVYEYLERRFNKSIRRVCAFVYILHMTIYTAMVVYTPSIALEAVTGLNMWVSALTSTGICILYTSLGGLRSAVWTDVFQVLLMVAGLCAVLIQGSYREGGLFELAWLKSERGGRTDFWNFDPNILYRQTFWTLLFGGFINNAFLYGINQAQIQRALSAKTLRDAQLSYWLNIPGCIIFVLLPGLAGFLLYARYQYCDPVTSGRILKRDQLLPIYVMEVLSEDIPGFPGLFVAMLFSGSLSTISSTLNGLGAVISRDFVEPLYFIPRRVSDRAQAVWTRVITLVFGILIVVLILIVEQLPGILDAAIALSSAFSGPIFGVFIIGIYLPFIKWQPVLIAVVISLAFNIWLTLGNMIAAPVNFDILQKSTEACLSPSTNKTFYPTKPVDFDAMSDWDKFYSISYMFYGVVGLVGTFVIALALTPLFGCGDPEEQRNISSPTAIRFSKWLQVKIGCVPKKAGGVPSSASPAYEAHEMKSEYF